MRFFAEDAEYLFYLGIIVYWFTRSRNNRQMVAEAILSTCAALGAGGIISNFYYRDRPFVHHTVIQLIQHPANASFPSDHATGAFVIATAIWLFRSAKINGFVLVIGGNVQQEHGAVVTDEIISLSFDNATQNSLLIGGGLVVGTWLLQLSLSVIFVILPVLTVYLSKQRINCLLGCSFYGWKSCIIKMYVRG